MFSRARATTKTIEDVEDLPGWDTIKPEDRPDIAKLINENAERFSKARSNQKTTPTKKNAAPKKAAAAVAPSNVSAGTSSSTSPSASAAASRPSGVSGGGVTDKDAYVTTTDNTHKDNSFRSFRVLVANVADTSGYLDKTELIRKYITKGNDGESFKGDVYLTMALLLPGKRCGIVRFHDS